MCEWFAGCTNPADGTVSHPVLGNVPTCTRCADKLELELNPGLRNYWGTLRADVGEGYCPDCERALPHHYESCPRGEYHACPDCGEGMHRWGASHGEPGMHWRCNDETCGGRLFVLTDAGDDE